MGYQVLARKWRPKNFEELMGQEHVVTVLVNALAQQRLHHAYLFTGTRGVGKTTIARIFAKSLNCETGITAKPCGQCDTCLEIDQGRFVDLLEIDAASKTKVDDTREILDNVQYAPTRGRYKVYLIDEVHMLSRHSFNALLKTLEEPPEHVKFILATTDPQKLPVTVLSRCLQFHLKALTVNQIETKLTEILAQEKVTHGDGTLTLLAKAARGSMRDSLSLTDQAIAQGQGNITLSNIQQMLGGIDQNWVYKIVIALLKQDGQSLMALTQEIASYAPSYSRLFAELIQLFHQIAILQIVDQHFDLPAEHALLLKKFSQAISAEDVQLYYQICVNGRKDLPYASDEQAAFDMTLLRLFAFKPMQREQLEEVADNTHSQVLAKTVFQDEAFQEDVFQEKKIELPNHIEEQVNPLEEVVCDEPQEELSTHEQELDQQIQMIEQKADTLKAENKAENKVENKVENETESSPLPQKDALVAQEKLDETSSFDSPMTAVLASRNMLRSRKKQLEQQEKKPHDANVRQTDLDDKIKEEDNLAKSKSESKTKTKTKTENKNVTLPKPEQSFQADKIDPATVRKANQVDQWAHMIDSMELIARLRQLAIHANIDENSTDNNLILCLDQATKHLYTETAQQQLQQSISQFLSRDITVTINIVEQTVADPYKIQSHINVQRYDYAKKLLEGDEIVQGLVQTFQASLNDESISAL